MLEGDALEEPAGSHRREWICVSFSYVYVGYLISRLAAWLLLSSDLDRVTARRVQPRDPERGHPLTSQRCILPSGLLLLMSLSYYVLM